MRNKEVSINTFDIAYAIWRESAKAESTARMASSWRRKSSHPMPIEDAAWYETAKAEDAAWRAVPWQYRTGVDTNT